jgi:F0F1-type ATP synthase alpha subunit
VSRFERELLEHFHSNSDALSIWNELNEKRKLDDDLDNRLEEAIKRFKRGWQPTKQRGESPQAQSAASS